jgi:hypothetical protein
MHLSGTARGLSLYTMAARLTRHWRHLKWIKQQESLQIVGSMNDLLMTLRLAIADSIMVSTHILHPTNTSNSHQPEGLEVLDHMQQELDGNNCPSGLECWIYRYVMALKDK